MVSPNFIRVVKIEPFLLDKPIGIQLAVTGSKSIINYSVNATIKYNEKELEEYFDIVNIDYYDAILGTPFLRKHEVYYSRNTASNTIPSNPCHMAL